MSTGGAATGAMAAVFSDSSGCLSFFSGSTLKGSAHDDTQGTAVKSSLILFAQFHCSSQR